MRKLGVNIYKDIAEQLGLEYVDHRGSEEMNPNDFQLPETIDMEAWKPDWTEKMDDLVESTHINDDMLEMVDLIKELLIDELDRQTIPTPNLTKTDIERCFDKINEVLNK